MPLALKFIILYNVVMFIGVLTVLGNSLPQDREKIIAGIVSTMFLVEIAAALGFMFAAL